MLIARRFEIIDEEFIINDFLVENFVAYVFYIYIHKKNAKNFKSVYKFKKTRISVALQNKKIEKKIEIAISKKWQHIKESFRENLTYELSKHKFSDHVIDFKKKAQSLYNFIYFLSKSKLKILKTYIKKHFANNFIRSFKSSIDASILFVKKKNDSFRLCVNYRDLNSLTIKNRYFLLLIEESLDRLSRTIIYNKFDIISTYHRIKIKKKNK